MSEGSLFIRALEIDDPTQRAELLSRECAGDVELRHRIELLLSAHTAAGGILDKPPSAVVPLPFGRGVGGEGAATDLFRPITEGPGTVIGPYKLLQQIGEGGFGIVYMAEQQRPVRRKVALKIIKPGMDTREVIARFESERQALALMDHPNIARVLDGGTTDSGRPYFVMELVKGVPLTQFCDDNKLDTRQRLTLFSTVCKAIQHAHHKGVIHRDIKPSNVMVTLHDGQPVPKVIDFGVSKAISQQLTEKTMFTAYGQMIGTPAYMSPEQAEMSGLDIDTRSDVYSLGVLLYELLTGSTPLGTESLRGKAYAELQRMIREDEPPRPSLRVSTLGEATVRIAAQRGTVPRELDALLRGELDWIVMKALEKNRDRRYESANTFSADIERYLKHEAIEACPPSTLYRLRKFIRRNRVACTTGGLIAATLLICTLISAIAARNALYNRRLAEDSLRVALADRQQAEQAQKNTVTALETATRERDRAEKAKAEESNQRQRAEEQRLAAEAAEKAAAEERTLALQERDKATAISAELAKQKEQQRRMLYVAQMNLIQTAWTDGNISRIQDLLNATRPGAGETDLRSIEWQYWHRMIHNEERSFRLPISLPAATRGFGGPPGFEPANQDTASSALLSHDGSRIAAILTSRTGNVILVWDVESGSPTPIFNHQLSRPTNSPSGRGTADGRRGVSAQISRIVHLDSSRVVLTNPTPSTQARPDQELAELFERLRNAAPDQQGALRDELSQRLQSSSVFEVSSYSLDAALSNAARTPTTFTIPSSFAFSRDGSRIATLVPAAPRGEGPAAPGTNIVILDGNTGTKLDQFPCPLPRALLGAISNDGQRIFVYEPRSLPPLSRERDVSASSSSRPPRQFLIVDATSHETTALRPQSVTSDLLNTTSFFPTCAFSPSADRLVFSSRQSSSSSLLPFLFDATTGQELPRSASVPSAGVFRDASPAIVALSPDGKWLASNAGDADQKLLALWDVATGKPGPQIRGHAATPVLAAFSSDSSRLISADAAGVVKVWPVDPQALSQSPKSGDTPDFFASRTSPLWNIASPDGRWKAAAPRSEAPFRFTFSAPAASGPLPLELKLEDTTGKTPARTVPLPGLADYLAFSPDSRYLAALTISSTAQLSEAAELLVWNVATLAPLSLPAAQFQARELSRSGFGSPERAAFAGPMAQASPQRMRTFGGVPPVFSLDSRRLAIGDTPSNNSVDAELNHLWDLEQQTKLSATLPKPPPSSAIGVRTPSFSPDSKLLLLSYPRSLSGPFGRSPSINSRPRLEGIHLLDAITGNHLWSDSSDLALSTFSADSRHLAAIWTPMTGSGAQPAIVIWNAATGEQLGKIELLLNRQYTSLAISPRGDRVAVQDAGVASVYEASSRKLLYTIDGLASRLVFSADGNRLVTSNQSNPRAIGTRGGPLLRRDSLASDAKIWDCVTGQQLLTVSTESPLFQAFQSGQALAGFPPVSPAAEVESFVDWLLAADADGNYLTRREISERIQTDASLSAAARTIAVELAASRKRSVIVLATAARAILNATGLAREQYQRALEWVEELLEQSPDTADLTSCQGVALYRLGDYASAQATLERSLKLRADVSQRSLPETYAFLCMAHHQLGHAVEARRLFVQAQREAEIINFVLSRMSPAGGFGSSGGWATSPLANTLESLYEASSLLRLPLISELISQAVALRDQQKYDQARAKIDEALALDNENATLFLERGKIWRLESEFDKAIADCGEAIRLNPKDPEAYNLCGLCWMAGSNAEKALADYNTALGLNPSNATYLTNRATAHRHLGNIPAALVDYNQAIRLSRELAPAWLYRNRADLWYIEQEMELAIQDATTWIRLDPRPVGYGNRGIFRLRAGDYDQAIKDTNEALRREPGAPIFLTNLGGAQLLTGELDAALENLDQAVLRAPQLAPARLWRGYLYEKQGHVEKATAEYDAFLKLSVTPAAGLLDRAYRWGYLKEYDKAIADYDALLALEPNHLLALCRRGHAWAAKENYENALRDFAAAVQAAPNRADAYQSLAWLRATCPDEKFRDPEAALAAATKANEISGGKYWKHLDTLAAAYAAAGNFTAAIKHEEAALKLLTGFNKPDYQSRLALYREGKPYRESLASASPITPAAPPTDESSKGRP